jgi:hypothetical protein
VDLASDPRLFAGRPRALVAATGKKRHGQGDGEYSTYVHVDETFKHAQGFHEVRDGGNRRGAVNHAGVRTPRD